MIELFRQLMGFKVIFEAVNGSDLQLFIHSFHIIELLFLSVFIHVFTATKEVNAFYWTFMLKYGLYCTFKLLSKLHVGIGHQYFLQYCHMLDSNSGLSELRMKSLLPKLHYLFAKITLLKASTLYYTQQMHGDVQVCSTCSNWMEQASSSTQNPRNCHWI